MASKSDWLNAGLETLAEYGDWALTIERLCQQLRLSKGSFYHHFEGMSGYKTALLAHFEEESTTRYIRVAEASPSVPADVKLDRLRQALLDTDQGPELEIAIRAWAQQDTEVRRVQERLDRTRVEYLTKLCEQLEPSPERASDIAHMLYMLTIGADHLIPPVTAPQLDRMYQTTLQLPGNRTASEPARSPR